MRLWEKSWMPNLGKGTRTASVNHFDNQGKMVNIGIFDKSSNGEEMDF